MLERKFQASLIKELKTVFPGCEVLKLDPTQIQGMPDLLVLYKDKWAALECKQNAKAHRQPNQDYYIHKLGEMSYSAFVYPENKKEVLNGLQRLFSTEGAACIS